MSNEIKRMKQGMFYTRKEKTIILNVFKYFKSEYTNSSITELVRKTSQATGCSEKSIFQFRKEEVSPQGFKEPSKTRVRKNININSRDVKYDESTRTAIKKIIIDLKIKDLVPSLNTIRNKINESGFLPTFSVMTLRRLLFDMGYYYEKEGKKFVLTEGCPGKHKNQKSKKKQIKKPVNTKASENILMENAVENVSCFVKQNSSPETQKLQAPYTQNDIKTMSVHQGSIEHSSVSNDVPKDLSTLSRTYPTNYSEYVYNLNLNASNNFNPVNHQYFLVTSNLDANHRNFNGGPFIQ